MDEAQVGALQDFDSVAEWEGVCETDLSENEPEGEVIEDETNASQDEDDFVSPGTDRGEEWFTEEALPFG